MSNLRKFSVAYDRDADVLYISTQRTHAARGVEDSYGVVWRYDGSGDLIGATIIDYYDYWHDKHDLLAREISRRFDIPERQAHVVLEHADAERNG